MRFTDRRELHTFPTEPGVYLMKDETGKVVYVGKALNLRKRLASYTKPEDQLDGKTVLLVRKIADIETVITATEAEALILESTLIRKYKPRYNILLKDDKRFPSLRLNTAEPYPRLEMVRKPQKDGAMYFGPFASPRIMYETLKFINKTFKLRKCSGKMFRNRIRPCLNYQIGVCLAPCCLDVNAEMYREIVKEVTMLLKGRTPELIRSVKSEMLEASEKQEYEKAAVLRDKMISLESVSQKQVAVSSDFKDRDVIAFACNSECGVFTLLSVRGGHLQGTRHFDFKETLAQDSELMESFIRQYYEKAHFIPSEIWVQIIPEHIDLLEVRLKELHGEKVSIVSYHRGEKAKLIDMAVQNAAKRLSELMVSVHSESEKLIRLQKRLHIVQLPERIECFDNSNIYATSPVSAMVVFEHGKPDKSSYRKYKIRTVEQQDDYAYMAEVLHRRFGKGEDSKPYPDLLMVDGGKGQLNIAVSVIRELGLEGEFAIIGIAKKDESKGEIEDKIYISGRANPIQWGRDRDILLFLEHIRDEAHRFAISFHRRQHRKASVVSVLDDIPGIGPKRKKMLLSRFGSVKNLRNASVEELTTLSGITKSLAEKILEKIIAS